MTYCTLPSPASASLSVSSGVFQAAVSPFGGSVSDNCAASQLSDNVYTVTWTLGSSLDNNGVYNSNINDCMNRQPVSRQLGTMVVVNGSGSGTYTLSGLTAPGEVQICVSDALAAEGLQVPVTLVI